MVIPKIVEILETVEFVMPTIEGVELVWNEAGIEIMTAKNRRTNNTKYCIFEILDTDNVGEGVVRQLYEAGYNTKSILKIKN
jgi:hypothetical protein